MTAHQPAQTLVRFHPIKVVRALPPQDVQKAQRQQHLTVGPALATRNARRQIPQRTALLRRTKPQLHASVRRHAGFGVRKLQLDRGIGMRHHFCTRLVKVCCF